VKININSDIFTLISAFERSDGGVAVLDDAAYLIGWFGYKEYRELISEIKQGENISNIKISKVINYSFKKIVFSAENNCDNINEFFDNNNFTCVPIVYADGKFKEIFSKNRNNIDLKRIIAERWHIYDRLDERFNDYNFMCIACGNEINTSKSENKITNCIFGGGKLIRYVCSHCEAIVGPLKMLALTPEELEEDYIQHYSVFSEGDSTELEIKTFHMLEPTKTGRYLNYGCGEWSRSIQILRDEGYDVWGYDPFAKKSDNEFIIVNIDEARKYRFDGIFSNNLLEHLPNPIQELKFMKSLLRDFDSNMLHATPCYEQCYEFTRFHLFFPVGKSADILFSKAGLKPYKRIEESLHGIKYICVKVRQI